MPYGKGGKKKSAKTGMVTADNGKGPTKKKAMKKGIAGLTPAQMQGGDETDEVKATKKKR